MELHRQDGIIPRRVAKLHIITVDCVGEKLSIYRRYSTFDDELANKTSLYDELGNVINLEWNQN